MEQYFNWVNETNDFNMTRKMLDSVQSHYEQETQYQYKKDHTARRLQSFY